VDVARFDQTLSFIETLKRANSTAEVCGALIDVTRGFGVGTVLAGVMPGPGAHARAEELESRVLLWDWPKEWFDHYAALNYIETDPVISYLRNFRRPVQWDKAMRTVGGNRAGEQVFSEARAFGLNDGYAVPMLTIEGDIVMISLGGEEVDFDQSATDVISLLATFAAGRALEVSSRTTAYAARPELSERERECLRWAAVGKSEWEISQILGISEHTAEKHLLNAKRKLRASNRVHAVAEALRLGYIT
jgi:LuxR family quorum sensing-dependent transcriptional regulator